MRLSFGAVLLATVPLITLPALGQDADDELIVTATRQRTEAERLPADVDVIDVDQARGRGVASLADALANTPGLNVSQSGGFGQQSSLFSGGANSNHTLVLFDGIRLNDPSTPGSTFDAGQDTLGGLTRIEIVQGPMSAVYGSDAIGGVVNVLPRHGGDGLLNADLNVWGGSFHTLAATAAIDGALGRFRYALTGESVATDGYDLVPERMSTHTGNDDGAESTTFTGVFDVAVTDRFALDLLVRHRAARADFDAFAFPPPSFNERRVDDSDLEIARNELTVGRLGADWRLSDALSLRATAGTLRQEREERDGGVSTATFEAARYFADLTANWRFANTGVLSNAGVLAGFEAQFEEVDIDQGFAAVAADREQRGGFITAQGDIGSLTLTGAARTDDFEGFGAQTTWRVGASYALNDGLRAYAAYGTSFRAPTLYERFVAWGNPTLNPERGAAWEIGGDARFAAFGQDDGIEFGLAYRSAEIEDLIDFDASFVYANIDEADIDNAEARIALRPAPWLTARVAYVFTDARDTAAGTPLLRRPDRAWTASLDFDHGPLTAQLAWRFVGKRPDQIYADDGFWTGVGVTPEYHVLRASAAWRFAPGALIYLAADNLADEAYEPVNAFAGAPRSVRVGVRLQPGK
ncbi:MAG: TonB-dependent receptor plug domain-containing protein [Hyphomonadaceae bacterium]